MFTVYAICTISCGQLTTACITEHGYTEKVTHDEPAYYAIDWIRVGSRYGHQSETCRIQEKAGRISRNVCFTKLYVYKHSPYIEHNRSVQTFPRR